MNVMIAALVGLITLSFAGVAAAGSRCEQKAKPPKEPREESAPHSVGDTLQKAHDTAMNIIQNMK